MDNWKQTRSFPLHMSSIAIIVIWPDPVLTSQVDRDLVAKVAQVGARFQLNSSDILV